MKKYKIGKVAGEEVKLYCPPYGNLRQIVGTERIILEYAGGSMDIEPGREYGYPGFFPKNDRTAVIHPDVVSKKTGVNRTKPAISISGYKEIPLDERYPGAFYSSVPWSSESNMPHIVGGTDAEGLLWGSCASPNAAELGEYVLPVYDAVGSRFMEAKAPLEGGVAVVGTFMDAIMRKEYRGQIGKSQILSYVFESIGLRPKVFADVDGNALVGVPVRGSGRDGYFPTRAVMVDHVPYHLVLLDMGSDDAQEAAAMGMQYTDDDLRTFLCCDLEMVFQEDRIAGAVE